MPTENGPGRWKVAACGLVWCAMAAAALSHQDELAGFLMVALGIANPRVAEIVATTLGVSELFIGVGLLLVRVREAALSLSIVQLSVMIIGALVALPAGRGLGCGCLWMFGLHAFGPINIAVLVALLSATLLLRISRGRTLRSAIVISMVALLAPGMAYPALFIA